MKVINKSKSNIKVILKDGSKGVLSIGYALDLDEKVAENLIKMYPREVVSMDSLLVSPEEQSLKQKLSEKEAEIVRLRKLLNKKEDVEEIAEQEEVKSEIELLKEEAIELGVEFSPNIGIKKLKYRIEEAKAKKEDIQ